MTLSDILCRNPAFTLQQRRGTPVLTTKTKDADLIFAVDAGGLAVWKAIPSVTDIGKGDPKRVAQVIDDVARSVQATDPDKLRDGIMEFIKQALKVGIVVPGDRQWYCNGYVRDLRAHN